MKIVSSLMKDLLKEEMVHFCWCIKIVRLDGASWGFTSHDQDVVVDGFLFEAEAAVLPSTVESTGQPSVDNLQAEGILKSDWITEEDLAAGRYDGARLEVYKADWKRPDAGLIAFGRYFLSKATWKENTYKVDLLSLKEAIQRVNGLLVDERCSAKFGDSRCKHSVSEIEAVIVSTSQDGSSLKTDAGEGAWAYGTVAVVGGKWDGLSREIKSASGGDLTLWVPMPEPLPVGQTLLIREGCDKTLRRCKSLGNVVNFRGMPHVPGLDKVGLTPDVKY